jgi:hypothetical protein
MVTREAKNIDVGQISKLMIYETKHSSFVNKPSTEFEFPSIKSFLKKKNDQVDIIDSISFHNPGQDYCSGVQVKLSNGDEGIFGHKRSSGKWTEFEFKSNSRI